MYDAIVITYPDNGVEFRDSDVFGSIDSGGDLLLMLLRKERKSLSNYCVQSFCDLSLKRNKEDTH